MTVNRTASRQPMNVFDPVSILYTFEELLLKLSLCDLNLDRLVDLLGMAATMVCVVLDGSREEGIDEGCLSETRFSSDLYAISLGSSKCWRLRTMMVKAAPRLATIL